MTRREPSPRRMALTATICVVLASAAAALPSSALADPKPVRIDTATVGDGLSPVVAATGVMAVNVTAGTDNQQANLAVFAIGDNALASGLVVQHIAPATAAIAEPGERIQQLDEATKTRTAAIAMDAFADASGLIAVNVSSGESNQQANIAAVAVGIEGRVLADAMLSQSRASPEPEDEPVNSGSSGDSSTQLGDGAFSGAAGIVQVSLLGGERNSSANTFAVSFTNGGGE